MVAHLNAWVNQKKGKPPAWRLLYRATRDGFDDYEIAKGKVTDRGPTLTVAKLANGQSLSTGATLVGGYASTPWQLDDGYVEDPKAFVFTADSAGSASALLKVDVTHVRRLPRLFPCFCTPKGHVQTHLVSNVYFDIEGSEVHYHFNVKKPRDEVPFTTVGISELEIFAV